MPRSGAEVNNIQRCLDVFGRLAEATRPGRWDLKARLSVQQRSPLNIRARHQAAQATLQAVGTSGALTQGFLSLTGTEILISAVCHLQEEGRGCQGDAGVGLGREGHHKIS